MSRRAFIRWLFGVMAAAEALLVGWTAWGKQALESVMDDEGKARSGTGESTVRPDSSGQAAHPSPQAGPVGGPAAGGALLSVLLLSDLHVNSGVAYPGEHLRKALDDMNRFESKVEALLVTGDLTESATEADYRELRSILDSYRLPPMHVNMGNHEYYRIWINDKGAWSKETAPNGWTDKQSREAFLRFFGLEKPYHSVKLNGYSFYFLSQETYVQEKPEVSEGAWYSDEQMEWFKAGFAEEKGDRPVFVMIHQPLPPIGQDGGAHQLIRAKEFREIVKPHPNVFVFWGHNHQDFKSGTPHYVKETFHGFNNSSVGRVLNRSFSQTNTVLAQGMYMEVFADRVRVRGREFSTREWVKEADWTVSLKTGKVM